MVLFVGAQPIRYYAGVITAVNAPYVTVRVSDSPDIDGSALDVIATGTGAVNDRVQLMVWPNGRATTVKN